MNVAQEQTDVTIRTVSVAIQTVVIHVAVKQATQEMVSPVQVIYKTKLQLYQLYVMVQFERMTINLFYNPIFH